MAKRKLSGGNPEKNALSSDAPTSPAPLGRLFAHTLRMIVAPAPGSSQLQRTATVLYHSQVSIMKPRNSTHSFKSLCDQLFTRHGR